MNNPASQQPAPIPEDLKELAGFYDWYLKQGLMVTVAPGIILGLIERIARLEAALTALRDFMWSEGYADQAEAMRQADAALGTPGRDKP